MDNIDEQTIRILKFFVKAESGNIPKVSEKSLLTYYSFLNKKLIFPIPATLNESEITITNLYPVDDQEDIDQHYGLICEGKRGRERIQISLAEIEVNVKNNNQQLIEGYQVWFWDNR